MLHFAWCDLAAKTLQNGQGINETPFIHSAPAI
jgi:hypothetical protein